jgi:hypothetical protein
MKAGEIIKELEKVTPETEVFFRRIAPICGNIEAVGKVSQDKFSSWGFIDSCIIFEPYKDDN